jgi:hypothetical protein
MGCDFGSRHDRQGGFDADLGRDIRDYFLSMEDRGSQENQTYLFGSGSLEGDDYDVFIRCERGSVVFRSPSRAKVQPSEIEGFRLIMTIPLYALCSPAVDLDDDW